MRQIKKSSPKKDELGIIDFTPPMKSKEVTKNIEQEPTDVKEAVETCMTIFFELMGGGK